jgi:2-polyprenyl-6-methoxyphenol hydroxylase-like FAD-dependent oxidoreductase
MLLARRGMRVLALDRGAYGSGTLSTHAVMRGAVLQLHRWGLLPRLRAAGTPPIRRTSFHHGAEEVAIDLRAADGVDALYTPRRTLLDARLVDAAIEAGAALRHGSVGFALERGAGGRMIGADGVGSSVAPLAGAAMLREARHATATVFGYVRGIGTEGYQRRGCSRRH